MIFPVVIKDEEFVAPDAPIYYVVSADGTFLVRNTSLYRSVTKVDGGVPGLANCEEALALSLPKLPTSLMDEVVGFFSEVNRLCGGEGVVILFYNPESGSYRVEVPEQTVPVSRNWYGEWITQLSVSYGRVDRPDGYLRCGSIHSHADLPAYASHTDCADEEYEDGLHLVVGHLGRETLSVAGSFTVAGSRFAQEVDDVTEPFDRRGRVARSCDQDWLTHVRLEFSIDGRITTTTLPELVSTYGGRKVSAGRLPLDREYGRPASTPKPQRPAALPRPASARRAGADTDTPTGPGTSALDDYTGDLTSHGNGYHKNGKYPT